MFKEFMYVVIYLNLMKPLANGLVIDAIENDTFGNRWLQPFNTISAPLRQWVINYVYPDQNETSKELGETSSESDRSLGFQKNELFEPHSKSLTNTNISETSSLANQQPEPISCVLETLRTEMSKADNKGEKYYTKLLMDIEQKFTQKSRYVRVFFNQMWHLVDLGYYGSSQRMRDASVVAGMLKPLRDLLKWIYKNTIDLLTWNIALHDDDEEPHEHSDKEKDEKEPFTHNEGGIRVTTKKGEGEDRHKTIHKFEIDPFEIKFNMDMTGRILGDSKDPNNPSTSISHHEGDIEIHKKLEETSPLPESASPKDSKPSPTPSDKGVEPIRPSTGIKLDPTPGGKEVVPSTSTANKGKVPDAKKDEKDKPPTALIPPNPTGGLNSKPTANEGDKNPSTFVNGFWRSTLPGYKHPETNPHFPEYKPIGV